MENSNSMMVAEIQLSYNVKVKASQLPKVTKSTESYKLLLERWDKGKLDFIEQVKVLLLNKGNRVLGVYEAGTGGLASCMVDIRLLMAAAINSGATSMILAHNHPSGNLKPSQMNV